jgi:vancomycin resistance protein VanJ
VPALLLLLGQHVPDPAGVASYLGTILPWSVLWVPVLVAAAFWWRSRLVGASAALLAVALAVVVLPPVRSTGRQTSATVTLVSENVDAANRDPRATIRTLAGLHADVVALEELTNPAVSAAESVLDRDYPHHLVDGTVGIWSTTPLRHVRLLDLADMAGRGLAVTLGSPGRRIRVYVVHLASFRLGLYQERNDQLAQLRQLVADDPAPRLAVAGDFNAASTDPAFRALTGVVAEHGLPLLGLGFTWPAAHPIVRLDHVLVRGLGEKTTVLPANGSDHRGVLAQLRP